MALEALTRLLNSVHIVPSKTSLALTSPNPDAESDDANSVAVLSHEDLPSAGGEASDQTFSAQVRICGVLCSNIHDATSAAGILVRGFSRWQAESEQTHAKANTRRLTGLRL